MALEGYVTDFGDLKYKGKPVPKWARTIFKDTKTGELFVPAVAFTSDMAAFLALSYDNTPMVADKDHVYVPLSWAEKEYGHIPKVLETLAAMRRKMAGAAEGRA